MRLAVYLSSHGLGHAARTCEILRQIPTTAKILVRTAISGDFLARETRHPGLETTHGSFDVGLVQLSNREIDWPGTAAALNHLRLNSDALVEQEARWLETNRIDTVLADMPPLAMLAAKRAGVRAILLANFTWPQIYAKCPVRGLFETRLLDEMEAEILAASECLVPGLSLTIPHPDAQPIGIISRLGTSAKDRLHRELPIPDTHRIVLVYLGAWGENMRHDALRPVPGSTMVAFHPVPGPVVALDPARWPFHDVLAAADLVVAKPGYGITAAALAHGVRLLHHPRHEFAEYPALAMALREAGNFHVLPQDDLEAGNWAGHALGALESPAPTVIKPDGASNAVRVILQNERAIATAD